VPAPVGEPVVTGNDGSNVVARGMGSGRIGNAGIGRDKELVGCKDKLCGPARFDFGSCNLDELVPAAELSLIRIVRVQRENLFPGFGGCYYRKRLIGV